MTLSIPKDLHEFIKKHNEINWSEIARRAMNSHAKKMKLMDELLKKSQLSEEDIDRLDHKIKAKLNERFSK